MTALGTHDIVHLYFENRFFLELLKEIHDYFDDTAETREIAQRAVETAHISYDQMTKKYQAVVAIIQEGEE